MFDDPTEYELTTGPQPRREEDERETWQLYIDEKCEKGE